MNKIKCMIACAGFLMQLCGSAVALNTCAAEKGENVRKAYQIVSAEYPNRLEGRQSFPHVRIEKIKQQMSKLTTSDRKIFAALVLAYEIDQIYQEADISIIKYLKRYADLDMEIFRNPATGLRENVKDIAIKCLPGRSSSETKEILAMFGVKE